MIVYNYDDTGLYLYKSKAQENPMKKGDYLMPGNSTTIEPLQAKEGYVNVFKNGNWEQVRNYTQTTVYSTETGMKADNYKELGELPATLTDKVPPQEYPKWTGSDWAVDEEEKFKVETEMQINQLKKELEDSDYKVIKSYEASLVGTKIEYDIKALHEQREQIRFEINKLENSL